MKKKIILIGLIFLMANTAFGAITVTKFPKPVLVLTLVSGGDLTASTTYYITGFFTRKGGYYGSMTSPAADQVSIATDTTNKTINVEWFHQTGSITSFADAGSGNVTVTTSAAHGLSNGNTVAVKNTTNYNGSYTISSASGSTFTIVHSWDGNDATGDWYEGTGLPAGVNGIILKWDNYSMIDSGDSEFYQWLNLNDPTHNGKNEFDESNGHRKWSHQYYTTGFTGTSANLTGVGSGEELHDGVSEGSTYRSGGMAHPGLAFRDTSTYYAYDSKLTRLEGKLAIEIDDSDSNNTWSDLVTALENSGYSNMYLLNKNSLTLLGGLWGNATVTWTEKNITFIGTHNEVANLTFDRCCIFNEQMGGNFWATLKGKYESTKLFHFGNALILDSVSYANYFEPSRPNGDVTFYSAASGFTIIGASYVQYRYFNAAQTFTDMVFRDTYVYATAGGTGSTETMTWTDCEWQQNQGNQNYDITVTYGYGSGETYDHTFNMVNCPSDRTDGKARINFPDGTTPTSLQCIFNFKFPVAVHLTDEQGDAISGASIKIIDTNGTEYTDTTDASGDSSISVITYTVEYDSGDSDGYGYYSDTTTLSPFTIEISKSGYGVYNNTFTTTSSQDWSTSLGAEGGTVIYDSTIYDSTIY